MKILWLGPYRLDLLAPELGLKRSRPSHPATWMQYLVEETATRPRIELHFVTTSPYVGRDSSIVKERVTYHVLRRGVPVVYKGFPEYLRLDSMTKYYFLKRKIQGRIRKIKPDIVTAHGTEDVFGYALNGLDCPTVVWIQGLMNDVVRENDTPSIRRQVKIENEVFRQQNDFISNCAIFDPVIKRQNRNARIHYLSYPISNETFTVQQDQKDADIAFVGSVMKRKGIEDLLDATALVKRQRPDVSVKVIGGHAGPAYQAFLVNKAEALGISRNVRWLGFLPEHRDVLKEMSKSRLLVLPTYVDTGPRAVAESMGLRVPVVSYDVDGLPWMIENGKRGILVQKGNIAALADAIVRVLNDPTAGKAMVDEAYAFARREFHAPTIIDNLLNVYEKVIASHKGKICS